MPFPSPGATVHDDLRAPAIDDWFWDVLETSGRGLRILCRKLEALPEARLFRFQQQYADAMDFVNPRDWDDPEIPAAARYSAGGEEFAAWVVSQGERFYEQVRCNHARLPEFAGMFE